MRNRGVAADDQPRSAIATQPTPTSPAPVYTVYMDPTTMDRLLAELTADELAAASEYLHLFIRSSTMPPNEADEWCRRIVAWRQFVGLSSAPTNPA